MRAALLSLALFALTLLTFAHGPDHVPGEVLVRLKPIAREADLRSELSKALPATITLKEVKALGPKSRYSKVSMAGTGMSDQELEKLIARLPGVEATSLNYKVKHLAEPNDAQYGTQWNLEDINVEPVWEVTTGGTMANGMRIGVALSDEAIQTNHPDLAGNIWPNSPAQGNGADHGTEVASVLGAVGNNSIGIAGVNWDVEIFSSGETEDLSDVIEQFEAATLVREQFNATNGASGLCVVSITASWGVENAGTCNGFIEPLFTEMTSAGILLVASGPNDQVSIESGTDFPANCALAEHLVVTSYGPNNETPFAFGPNTVHLLAPGVDIPVATVPSTYAVYDGNSFAIPTVAGAIALLYSIPCPSFAQLVMDDPEAARALVKNAILNNTAFFPGGNALTITGGKLDVHAAYQALMAGCAPTCTEYTISMTTTGDPVTSWWITDVDNAVILTGGGNIITTCLDDGCYTINLLGANSLPMEADYIVEDANGEVAIGNSFGGIIQFGVGVQIPGCTVAGSSNYDPQANCNDGSCCTGEMLQVIVVPEDFQSEGTAEMVVTSNGSVLFSGPMDIVFDADFGVPAGGWEGCASNGCFSVQVTNASVPLNTDGFVFMNGDLGNPESFPVSTGYFAAIGGAVGSEVCDGLDNDCDGSVDEDFIWYVDADGDGYGVIGTGAVFCSAPASGFAQLDGDCDDANAAINPNVPDPCSTPDGIDNNCDGNVDEVGMQTLYADLDGDGFGVDEVFACEQGPGLVLESGDCDDANATVFPGAPELCDGLDNDCDGELDEDFLWYADADGDGFGVFATAQLSCTPIAGHVQVGGDCDDSDANITVPGQACDDGNPATSNDQLTVSCVCLGTSGNCPAGEIEDCNGNCAPADWVGDGFCDDGSFEHNGVAIFFNCAAFGNDGGDCENCVAEVCDGEDNDCDGHVDENFILYVDADGDGWGDAADPGAVICEPPPTGFSSETGDCDDTNAAIFPNAPEVCDGVDNNCDGITDGTTVNFQTGCADPMACNYDPDAVCGGGTCTQGSIADGSETFATDFTATDVNGNAVNLFALLAQGKSVVLDFFTTWCPPSNQMNSAGFLQDWYAHMGPMGLDHIRMVSIEIEDTATVAGSLAPFLQDATWPLIANGGSAIAQQYSALGLYNNQVPTLVMICPDRSAQMIYPQQDQLPYTGFFQYDHTAALQLLNEKCGCRGTPCTTNIGCMDVNACNYDPSATCPGPCSQAQEWFTDLDGDGYGTNSLGTACTQPANSASLAGDCNDNDPDVQVGFDLYVLSETENDFGSAHYVIAQGSTVIEGDIQLPEETQGIGMLNFCIGAGCFSVQITPNDVPLWEEAYITPPGNNEDGTVFNPADGFFGSLTSTGPEVCDGVDNDCDGLMDEGCGLQLSTLNVSVQDETTFFLPGAPLVAGAHVVINHGSTSAVLADGYSTAAGTFSAASIPAGTHQITVGAAGHAGYQGTFTIGTNTTLELSVFLPMVPLVDADQDGAANSLDCDDTDPTVYPGAPELCDGVDNNCNGLVDEPLGADGDADGFTLCEGDCDDADASIFPGAPEPCDGIDNDCDGLADEDSFLWYIDADADGFGDPSTPTPSCTPIFGYAQNNLDCDDTELTVNPITMEYCDGLDNDCNGIVDDVPDSDGDGLDDCADNCRYLPGQIGDPCPLSADPLVPMGIINPTCTCTVACTQNIVVDLRTDLNSQEASFIIRDEISSQVRCQGSGFFPGVDSPIIVDCCLPEGCFKLEVFDSGGDGFVSGGYQVREAGPAGRRIIDNFGNFTSGSISTTFDPASFCLPLGEDKLTFASCDKLTWVSNQYLVARENTGVSAEWVPGGANNVQDANSGYEFWIFDPNGSYSFRRFRSHNVSDGFSPATGLRACHMKLNSWVNGALTPHVPTGMLLNVRVRGRVNGTDVGNFGPACTMRIDPVAAACPLIWLQDDPANTSDFSCGVQRNWGGGNSSANKIVAKPPQFVPTNIPGPVRYQFRFRIPGEGVCITRPPQSSPTLYLNWNTGTPLQCSKTYEVDVRASKDGGATWCTAQQSTTCDGTASPWGRQCFLTINPCASIQAMMTTSSAGDEQDVMIFPNPNNGQRLHLARSGAFGSTIAVLEFNSINGSEVLRKELPLDPTSSTFTVDLDGMLSSGVHIVRVHIGDRISIHRLVVQEQ